MYKTTDSYEFPEEFNDPFKEIVNLPFGFTITKGNLAYIVMFIFAMSAFIINTKITIAREKDLYYHLNKYK